MRRALTKEEIGRFSKVSYAARLAISEHPGGNPDQELSSGRHDEYRYVPESRQPPGVSGDKRANTKHESTCTRPEILLSREEGGLLRCCSARTNRPTVPPELEASYSVIIDKILAASDLNTISAKRIRKGLQAEVDYDITPQKVCPRRSAYSKNMGLIGSRMKSLN